MLVNHIALVSLSKNITPAELAQASAALQKQVLRDLGPIWGISASVDSFPDLKSVPLGYWPIIITENMKDPSSEGYHNDHHNQPYALVKADNSWQMTCSHEMCEMLVDPYGNRLEAAGSLDPKQGKVHYLVEVCDPCEDASYAYSINGILVCDFYTPNFFDPQVAPGVRYSFTGAITKPCEVLKNGYLSWQDPVSRGWYQQTRFNDAPLIKPLAGMMNSGQSLRSQVDRLTRNPNQQKAYTVAARKYKNIQKGVEEASLYHSETWRRVISKYVTPGSNLTEGPIQSPAEVRVTFSGGSSAEDFVHIALKDDQGRVVSTGTIDRVHPGPVHFDNAPAGYEIATTGFSKGKATIVISGAKQEGKFGPGFFNPSFYC
ncbi:hypothetical protein [Dinghuibacter silviterrae]|uniref:Uncharacterized protein n=1 Tax=Dinghuibacter silviterrae TaxID=1539049 RepID=A0A4R8DXR6_9BACT|nr:hypothetical protein [Dinghuibacter silviterrae]TDX02345.1 hypothetical protein EDB95_3403 [Dinghuibacter silviterrae]